MFPSRDSNRPALRGTLAGAILPAACVAALLAGCSVPRSMTQREERLSSVLALAPQTGLTV